MTEIESLRKLIYSKIQKLDDKDAESHIWYGKFLTLIDENASEMDQQALFAHIAEKESVIQ
jgi:hypothetical protein